MTNEERLKDAALAALKFRKNNKPGKIDNSSLKAGEPMYFYCKECGWISDVLSEGYVARPRRLCTECQQLKDSGWI